MTIEKTVNGNETMLKLEGWMDTQGAPMLEQALGELGTEVKHLVLDLKGLEYTSSAGIRQIVAAHKQMNGELTLRNVNIEIMDVLTMTGVAKKLHIEP
jgi:anti-anti-sigma factor